MLCIYLIYILWQIVFDVFLVSEYIDMMPTNVTADVVFGDVDSNTQQQYTLSHQYLPGELLMPVKCQVCQKTETIIYL